MQPGWCLICGGSRAEELARKDADRVAARLKAPDEASVRFVICTGCGHVYQDPMLDQGDLERVYTDDYRPLLRTEAQIAQEMQRGLQICEQFAGWVESVVRGRTVLDIGCGSGSYLLPFKERGWEVCGIDPVPAWTDFVRRHLGGTPDTIVTGHYGPESFPGRRFSLILFSHTVEHIPDPVQLLRQMREHLEDDGVLFIATPNLVNPPGPERLFRGFFSGAHVRLYSPAALRTLLARCGFRTDGGLDFPGRFGMALLARPGEHVPEQPQDDWMAIRQLYEALQQPDSPHPFGRNLLALRKTQRWIVPILCRRMDAARYRVGTARDGLTVLLGVADEGRAVLLARWDGRGPAGTVPDPDPPELDEDEAVVVQLGLGSGAEALALARQLRGAQHLYVWEADPVLAKLVLKVTDLSPLWESGRVTLLLGPRPMVPPAHSARVMRPAVLSITEAARRWNSRLYCRIREAIEPVAVVGSLSESPRFAGVAAGRSGEGPGSGLDEAGE